ncbi:MAG: hypothetical protein ACLTMP_10760 [Eggerthella lenta]
MQLPVDIKAVIDEATNIDEARRTTLSVSVYLDDSAPGDVQAHVRQAFASASPHAACRSCTSTAARSGSGDDAVIVAGLNEQVGVRGAGSRGGRPVMVVTTLPALVADIAKARALRPAGRPVSPSPQGRAGCAAGTRCRCGRRRGRAGSGRRFAERAVRSRRRRRRLAQRAHGRLGDRRVQRQAPRVRAGVPVRAQAPVAGSRELHGAAERGRGPAGHHSGRRHAGHDAQPSEDAAHDCRRVRRRAQHGAREGAYGARGRRVRLPRWRAGWRSYPRSAEV